ncbi:hypothetical protein I8748_31850 [Nostoc sp. CENA67]|uniref:Uncharacterized protein n=1 Tax=Amazonocrinis nigriterrae CENA67 TaxID=2794033 RepID=A0A8J7LBG0_9NOST|nr:hypothetical protein [Amazonocrinis nigriterrae]MBH8566693.1 hypothetical protein [Amazonocrinis nigriterrae CENA67]
MWEQSSMMNVWRREATSAIEGVVAKFDLNSMNKDQKARLRCAIDAAYPFELQKNHPYQIWLDERRKAFSRLGLDENENKVGETSDQLSLFDL